MYVKLHQSSLSLSYSRFLYLVSMSFSQFVYQPTSLYHARAPIQCTVPLVLTIDHLQDSLWCWWDISCHGLELHVFTVPGVPVPYGVQKFMLVN